MEQGQDRRITPVILCGGAGTRLWPVSRRDRPKPLVALTGVETMLQATALRTADPDRFLAPVVVTGSPYAQTVVDQLDLVGAPPLFTIVEPCARNTAAAIALAG
jgi:mannose-1-phosphate guanylyltransferase/mannose-1-phosphate guanylyltransferase/mannose-6-phosphate isomerase